MRFASLAADRVAVPIAAVALLLTLYLTAAAAILDTSNVVFLRGRRDRRKERMGDSSEDAVLSE